ncbi:17932_t:CDS:2 [Funneliformis geosporum]|uniref:9857_t:CDS:1 n=1 Tax=Funneliformis geosporum TaxID=1117311 RepID=A0A9W4SRM7_9GLOM|nr:17932_t:CDS:2 [Funneliformis geosporum]CAI2178390.1 9857_t:CDS:2 [Funneliformis geosporum]
MAITIISTPPAVITREQARQMQQNPPEDGIIGPIARHTQQHVRVQFSPPAADALLGKGTLWVTERQVYFYSWDTNNGLAIDYPTIIIHGISRHDTGPSIYTQLDEKLNPLGRTSQSAAHDIEEEEEDHTSELKFIPDDIGALDAIFEAFSECAALHPDKEFMASLAYLESIIDDSPTNLNHHNHQQQNDYDEEMFQDAEEDKK